MYGCGLIHANTHRGIRSAFICIYPYLQSLPLFTIYICLARSLSFARVCSLVLFLCGCRSSGRCDSLKAAANGNGSCCWFDSGPKAAVNANPHHDRDRAQTALMCVPHTHMFCVVCQPSNEDYSYIYSAEWNMMDISYAHQYICGESSGWQVEWQALDREKHIWGELMRADWCAKNTP